MSVLFEKFRINSCIKENAHSAVYSAEHIFLDKPILLKTLQTEGLKDPQLLERFKAEGKILAQLDHPNIIKVLDFGIWKQTFYISFEYFKSDNLRQYINVKKRAFAPEIILRQICSALEYAHQMEIIHRDLKPENILLNDSGIVKIADFGLAMLGNDSLEKSTSAVLGTPAYMSPEQIRGEVLSTRSDLFSLGIIITEIYNRKNPFLGSNTGETINNILQTRNENLQNSINKLPAEIAPLASELLLWDVSKRQISAAEASVYFREEGETESKATTKNTLSKRKTPVIVAVSLFFIVLFIAFLLNDLLQTDDIQGKISDPILPNAPSRQSEPSTDEGIKQDPSIEQIVHETKPAREIIEQPVNLLPGRLMIECLPWASVRVDSQEYDTTPLSEPITLSAGYHELFLTHPNFPEYSRKVSIKPEKLLTIKINLNTLMGYLDCQVYPWGEVFVNKRSIGQTPLSNVYQISPGTHELVVRNPRFTDHRKIIEIMQGDTLVYKHHFKKEKPTFN